MTYVAIPGLLYNGHPVAYDDGAVTTPPNQPPTTPPAGVRIIDLPWGAPGSGNVRIDTRQHGGFHDETIAVRFTTPNVTSTALAKLSAIESNATTTIIRTACLSEMPGDLDHPVARARSVGISVTLTYGVGTSSLYAANLQPGKTYYLNIKNVDNKGNPTCPPGVSADMFIELAKPSGL